jgi:hypothetical protein
MWARTMRPVAKRFGSPGCDLATISQGGAQLAALADLTLGYFG